MSILPFTKWVVYAVDWETQGRNSLASILEALMCDVREIFGHNLRAIRQSRGFTQERLAYVSGIDRSYVGKIERGQVNLTIDKLYLLAATLGCSPKDLIPEIWSLLDSDIVFRLDSQTAVIWSCRATAIIISYVQQRIQSVFGITSAGSRQRLFVNTWPKGCENLSAPEVLKDIINHTNILM